MSVDIKKDRLDAGDIAECPYTLMVRSTQYHVDEVIGGCELGVRLR